MTTIKELLPISNNKIGEEEVNAIDARHLHEFLNVKTGFNSWIRRRIEDCRLLENRDYIWVDQKRSTQTSSGKLGATLQKSVILSIDAAKHISMIERTDRGFEAREYFIDCEKQLILNTVLANTVEERMLAMSEYRTVIVQPLLEFKEEGVQYKDKKGEWALYAKYKDRGYASTKTQVIKNGEYEVLKVHLKWTQKGRLFIYELLKNRGIFPVCEQPC